MISAKEIIERRNKLFEIIKENSIVILFAGVAKRYSADETFPFETNHNFYYLTNIKEEGSILILKKNLGEISESLFIPISDSKYEKWIGKRISIKEAKLLSGISNILFVDQFGSELNLLLSNNTIENIYLDLDEELKIGSKKSTLTLKEDILKSHPNRNIIDIYKDIIRFRMKKSDDEIAQFKKAIDLTNIGLTELLKNIKSGKKEYEMAALFQYIISTYNNSTLSFPTICSTGANSTCLHYTNGREVFKDGDLVLFDLGSRHNLYCADISRTYPINGKYSSLQKKIYTIVLDCNKEVLKRIKPGITLKELNDFTIEYLASRCLEEGLIKTKEEIKEYYYHSVSHYIGLDTHDPAFSKKEKEIAYREIPLEEGNVISDEPGLYFKEYGIGVRIEDDVLVTKDGSFCLSKDIIKEVNEIEDFMKKYNKNIK